MTKKKPQRNRHTGQLIEPKAAKKPSAAESAVAKAKSRIQRGESKVGRSRPGQWTKAAYKDQFAYLDTLFAEYRRLDVDPPGPLTLQGFLEQDGPWMERRISGTCIVNYLRECHRDLWERTHG